MQIPISDDGTTPGTPGLTHSIDGDFGYAGLFIPTARLPGPQFGASERNKTRTFSKGYHERITLITNTAAHWMWRRIVFRKIMLPQILQVQAVTPTVNPNIVFNLRDTTRGQMRTTWNMGLGSTPNIDVDNIMQSLIFDGTEGSDWASVYNAKTAKRFIKVVSDRTRQLGGAQTAQGRAHRFQEWYPVNRTLVYDDEESGATPDSGSTYSDSSRFTAGDLCIYDTFQCINGTESDILRFGVEGTYYWHE